jgi:hypothetical protein
LHISSDAFCSSELEAALQMLAVEATALPALRVLGLGGNKVELAQRETLDPALELLALARPGFSAVL